MRNGKQLYRNPENARIAGVCSGVAEYFGLETWLVRILVVTGFFLLAGPFILLHTLQLGSFSIKNLLG